MKKFYKSVSTGDDPNGTTVLLDGRPVRSPGKALLVLPTEALAEAVAAEWEAQGEEIVPDSMPMMSLAATTLDRVLPQRNYLVEEIAKFGGSDLLCYPADEPPELVMQQQESWGPHLDWFKSALEIDLQVTVGVMPVRQPEESLQRIREEVDRVPDWELSSLHTLTSVYGSLILALSVQKDRLDAMEAFDLSQLDETYQAERWGHDREAEIRSRRLRSDTEQAAKFLALTRS